MMAAYQQPQRDESYTTSRSPSASELVVVLVLLRRVIDPPPLGHGILASPGLSSEGWM